MFIDTRTVEHNTVIETTVCIIGGGVAGITLAREMSRAGVDTCMLESGGFGPDDETRDLYRGENAGLPYSFADGCAQPLLRRQQQLLGWLVPPARSVGLREA